MSISRSFLRGSVGVLAFVVFLMPSFEVPAAPADDAQRVSSREELVQQRKKAAWRKRRMIFNNDGNDAVRSCDEATPEAMLQARTSPLLGSHVDSIFYCTFCSGFSNFTHNTKLGTVFSRKEDEFSNNKVAEFIQQGTDPLQIIVHFCRRHGIEVFWSMRMNDTHDASTDWYGPLLFPQLKKDHPEWLLGSKAKRPQRGRWTAVDYGRPEIRDLALGFFREVCENYEVDGVEMDFFRHLNYFKTPAAGKDATDQERQMMTDLVRRIREMTEEVGLKRGRPILVAVRVPDSVGYCRAMGLDVEQWLKEDLVDLLVPSGYFRLNPWEVSVHLGHKYNVPVYPCLSESRMTGEAGKVRTSLECYRARAMNVWDSGADGVYVFNVSDPHDPIWTQLGEPKVIERKDKVYCTGARSVRGANGWLARGNRFLERSPLSPESPRRLKLEQPVAVELRLGEDVAEREKEGLAASVALRILARDVAKAEDLRVKLDDESLGDAVPSGDWLEYTVAPAQVSRGVNRIEFTLRRETGGRPTVADALLWVRYKAADSR